MNRFKSHILFIRTWTISRYRKPMSFFIPALSGVASRAAEMLIKGTKPALIHVGDVSIDSKEVVSMSASGAGQTSNAYSQKKHGLFTYFLLRALRGEADANDDRLVSVKEIYNYIKNHVTRVSRRMGSEQTPFITPSLDALKDMAVCRSVR